jgi:HEPN domain-containing protein
LQKNNSNIGSLFKSMTNKEKNITYWETNAIEDIEVVAYLFKGKKYAHALFFTHLALEKY